MPVFETYSRRKRRAEQGEPEVYQYERVPSGLRVQVRHILDSALGRWVFLSAPNYFGDPLEDNNRSIDALHNQLLREQAQCFLSSEQANPKEDILGALNSVDSVEDWLDMIELCFARIYNLRGWSKEEFKRRGISQDPQDAIEELNIRFRNAGFGYQFEAGQIVRVDSQFLHSVVKPALVLLADSRFRGAQEEFLSAHAHYRAGEYEDAVVDANRAFESTMKVICEIKEWKEFKTARGAGDLIRIVSSNGLLPGYMITALQSGLPQVRNKAGGHGQGGAPRQTSGYVAGYALHLAAANIVLLVEALQETESK